VSAVSVRAAVAMKVEMRIEYLFMGCGIAIDAVFPASTVVL
jgi:hypothetical protein